MVIPYHIDAILRNHNYDGKSKKEATGYRERQVLTAKGDTFRVPLKSFNVDRDVMMLFVNGTFLMFGEDYTFDKDYYTIKLNQTLVENSELVFYSFKSVKRFLKYDTGALIQAGTIYEHKLNNALRQKLVQPDEAEMYLDNVEELTEEFAEISKAFAALELSMDISSRIDTGVSFGDYFKSPPIRLGVDLYNTVSSKALAKGTKAIDVETTKGLYSGQEITVFDRAGFERVVVDYITGNVIILKTALLNSYVVGAGVARSMGTRDASGALRFQRWTYRATNESNYYPLCDVRYTLYKSDQIVAWVKALPKTSISMAVSFKDKVTFNISQTNDPMPNIRWLELTPSLIRFEASAPIGFIQSVSIQINGGDPISLGSNVGFYTYNVPQDALRLEYNDIKVIVVNTSSGTHEGNLVYEKRLIEEFVDATVFSDGKEKCFTADSRIAQPVSIRLSMTFDSNLVAPNEIPTLGINYILGGYSDGI